MRKFILGTLSTLIIISVVILLIVIDDRKSQNDRSITNENSSIKIENDNEEKMQASKGGGAVALKYSNIIAIDLEKSEIEMYFKNPNKSLEKIKIDIILNINGKDQTIATTDLVAPGSVIENTKLNNKTNLESGNYNGKMVLSYYDEDTNAKQVVNTNIEITATVK